MSSKALAMILAGGKGSRLTPLTCHRAKPAVPFGGRYRIIDFVLSNFVNSGYRQIYILTQYMASSLIKHINRNWHLSFINSFIEIVPAQMRMGEHWYRGTADSVYQNINLIRDSRSDHIAIFGGDHIYKFDISQMEVAHRDTGADLTIAAFPVPLEEASKFGVIEVDPQGKVIRFWEKPKDPIPMPNAPDMALVSMGNYFFRSHVLQNLLIEDAKDSNSSHDFGKDIIPKMVREGYDVRIYNFADNKIVGDPPEAPSYWRDVGTIESYFLANMELRGPLPSLNLYNRQWRINTAQRHYPPARFVRSESGKSTELVDSLICEGSIVENAKIIDSLIGYDCFIHRESHIEDSLLLSGCNVGSRARLKRVLFDKNCSVAPDTVIGEDPEEDRKRFPFITESGIIVLPKGTFVPKEGPIEFAYDIAFLLENDPSARPFLEKFEGEYTVSNRSRHSYESSGPRYWRFH